MEPLNLVFIMSDEHNARMLGCYGYETVKTPHIDALRGRLYELPHLRARAGELCHGPLRARDRLLGQRAPL